jgi:hypothetical protein
MIRALLGLMVVAVGLAAAVLQEGQPWTGEAAVRAVRGLCGALLWAASATGLGSALLGRGDRPVGVVAAGACGLGVLGLVLLPLVGLGLLGPVTLGIVLVAGLAAGARRPQLTFPETSTVILLLLAVWAVPGLLDALSPPVDTDEVYQHLALPKLMWESGGLVGGLLQPDGSRPLPVHMVWTGAWLVGGEAAPKLLHLIWALALGLKVGDVVTRRAGREAGALSVALLLGSYTFVRELGLAYNNLPAALWVLLALEAALQVDPDGPGGLGSARGRLAVFAGMALACKYTAAGAVVGVFLIAWQRLGWRRVGKMAVLSGAALAWVAPWWLRNAFEGLHPLFPYAGWPSDIPLTFMLPEKYGVGREPLDLLLLPWHATVAARTDSFVFLGRVTPAALALAPVAVWAGLLRRDPVLLAAIVAFVAWAAGPHWLRYLLPAAPLLVVCAADGYEFLGRLGRSGAWMVWWLGLPGNLGPWLADVVERAPAAVGAEDREALLTRTMHGYGAVKWVNDHAPEGSPVALLFAWPTYHVDRPTLLGSVEDHIPSRYLVLRHGDRSLEHLRTLGVTHVLAHRVRFLEKSYPFMPAAEFEAAFAEPARILESELLADGVLVYEEGRFGVWRIDGD